LGPYHSEYKLERTLFIYKISLLFKTTIAHFNIVYICLMAPMSVLNLITGPLVSESIDHQLYPGMFSPDHPKIGTNAAALGP